MLDRHLFALFLVTGLALNITPGPDMLYVLACGMKGSRHGGESGRKRGTRSGAQQGVAAALGIGVGGLVHTALAAVGLSALIVSSAHAFSVVKYLGAGYLVYMGVKALLAKGSALSADLEHAEAPTPSSASHVSLRRTFGRGVVTNVLNPKVAIFFLAFVPQFVDPARGHITMQFAALGTVFCISGTLVNALVGWLSGSAGRWFRTRAGLTRFLDRATGAIFVALGIRLALVSRN